MELLQLQYFCAVAGSEGMVSASKSLHVSQPALSMAISRLENELGVRLFEKQGRRNVLTRAGEHFYEHSLRLLTELENAKRSTQILWGNRADALSIASEAIELSNDLLAAYLFRYPGTQILQSTGSTDYIREQLMLGRVDVCLSFAPFTGPDVISERLFDERMFLFLSIKNPLADKDSVALSDLQVADFVTFPKSYGYRTMMEGFFYHTGFRPQVRFEVCDLNTSTHIVENGLAVSFLPEFIWNETCRVSAATNIKRNAKALPVDDAVCHRTVYLSYIKDKSRSDTFCGFYDLTKKYCALMCAMKRVPSPNELYI